MFYCCNVGYAPYFFLHYPIFFMAGLYGTLYLMCVQGTLIVGPRLRITLGCGTQLCNWQSAIVGPGLRLVGWGKLNGFPERNFKPYDKFNPTQGCLEFRLTIS